MQHIDFLAPIVALVALATAVWAQPASEPAADVRAATAPRPAASPAGGERREWERIHRVSRILGSDVRNREGQKIGDLKDLIIDNQGHISLAVVSTGGFLGLNDRLHAVPWNALRADDTGARLLDMDRAQLGRVAGFSERDWPDLTDEAWQAQNRKQFGR